ncbi:hypothetical protein U0070_008475 [Myodes glareolus]|uniref:Uncharacterized protein n=1 Tax=Myodes glareolus TaxID=447135 RepID=A0AAW0I5I5_MYOGA
MDRDRTRAPNWYDEDPPGKVQEDREMKGGSERVWKLLKVTQLRRVLPPVGARHLWRPWGSQPVGNPVTAKAK